MYTKWNLSENKFRSAVLDYIMMSICGRKYDCFSYADPRFTFFNTLLVTEKSKALYNYLLRVEANGKAALGQ